MSVAETLDEVGYTVVDTNESSAVGIASAVRDLLSGPLSCERLSLDEIRVRPHSSMQPYTNNAMSLHTDSVYFGQPLPRDGPRVRHPSDGGHSVLRDTRQVDVPEALGQWLRRPVWRWVGREGTVTSPRPVLSEDFGLRWWRRTLTGLTEEMGGRADEFDALVSVESELVELQLKAGEVLVVDNRRVVHGRRPFRGDRLMLRAWGW